MLCEEMSDKMLLTVWRNCPVGGSALLLLAALAEACNEQGNCYVKLADLAAAARISRKSATLATKLLRDERWIVSSRISGQGGKLVYQLNIPKLNRSQREGYNVVAMEAQRKRATGPVEAYLVERVKLRKLMGKDDSTSGTRAAPVQVLHQGRALPAVKGEPDGVATRTAPARHPHGTRPGAGRQP
jgi:hypothetical protein